MFYDEPCAKKTQETFVTIFGKPTSRHSIIQRQESGASLLDATEMLSAEGPVKRELAECWEVIA